MDLHDTDDDFGAMTVSRPSGETGNCPECSVINYGINPRCVACVRKIMGDEIAALQARNAELEAELSALKQAARAVVDTSEEDVSLSGYESYTRAIDALAALL